MAGKDDIEKKLDEVDKRLNADSIRKHYKVRLLARINKGESGLLETLKGQLDTALPLDSPVL